MFSYVKSVLKINLINLFNYNDLNKMPYPYEMKLITSHPDHIVDSPGALTLSNLYKEDHNVLFKYVDGSTQEKKITISIDKSMHNVRLTLSDNNDVFFLYSLIITYDDYIKLKNNQGLLVNYPEFSDRIIDMLRQCDGGKMFLCLSSGKLQEYIFEFVERSDLKNLVHLQLNILKCETDEIVENVRHKMSIYKDVISSLEKKNQMLINQFETVCKNNDALTRSLEKSEEKTKKDYEQKIEKLNDDYQMKLSCLDLKVIDREEEIRNLNIKLRDVIESQEICKSQENRYIQTIDKMSKELVNLENEFKKMEKRNNLLDTDYHRKEKELVAAQTEIAVLQQTIKEKNDILEVLKQTVTKADKENEVFRAELTTRSEQELKMKVALQKTSEDLIKANQIIAHKTVEREQLKKKINMLSKISINVEKENSILRSQLEDKSNVIDKLQDDLNSCKCHVKEMSNEYLKLQSNIESKENKITELKKLIDIQYQKLLKKTDTENVTNATSIDERTCIKSDRFDTREDVLRKNDLKQLPASTSSGTSEAIHSGKPSKFQNYDWRTAYFKQQDNIKRTK